MNTEKMAKGSQVSTVDILRMLTGRLPGVAKSFDVDESEVVEVRVKKRTDGLMLIVKRLSPDDGTPEIRFGNAHDLESAMLMLNRMVENPEGWRADRPMVEAISTLPLPLPKVEVSGKLRSPRAGKKVV